MKENVNCCLYSHRVPNLFSTGLKLVMECNQAEHWSSPFGL